MKKVELLSPVGNMATLPFAIHNGCDAVYFSGKKFGARKFAGNFDNNEIVDAIKYCHLYGVKAYVTVNTLMFDNEIESVLEYIDFLHRSNVDAIIMQDIGLMSIVHEMYPNLEIHASTQCHNHNDEGISFFEKIGCKRVVLDREMSLNEIKKLDTKLEKEVFVHGALCVSYSGCCLFSSMNGGRSGNRGECVASCRLKYELYKNNYKIDTDGDYLLSTKELNTLNRVSELIDAGIDSFKIEGRMKSPEYVGFVTRLYRIMIDKYYNHDITTLDAKDLYDLKKLYNREFTEGYLFNQSGKKLMNIKTPNHLGVKVGKVIYYDKKYIKILLNEDVKQEDGIRLPNNEGMILNRIYNDKLLLVNKVAKGNILIIDNKVNLNTDGFVLKTIDRELIDNLKKYEEKKIPINVKIICKINKPIKLILDDGFNVVQKEMSFVEKAATSPTTKERIIAQISKIGNTPFVLNNIDSEIDDDIFVSIKDLNELRRTLIDELIFIRENPSSNYLKNTLQDRINFNKDNNIRINVLVRNEGQLKTCIENKVDVIYVDDQNLYKKYKNETNIYLRLPRVMLNYPEYKNEKLMIREFGSLSKYKDYNEIITDYTMNTTNVETVKLLQKNKVKWVTLSPEVIKERLFDVDFSNNNVEYFVYGTVELMVMKYCPIKMLENDDNDKCNLCSMRNKYYFKDQNNNYYPIINSKHFTYVMHKEVLDNIQNIKFCLKKGINNYRIELFEETNDEIESIIMRIRKELGD